MHCGRAATIYGPSDACAVDLGEREPRCSYCVKTNKHCTFDWLQAQQSSISWRPPKAPKRQSATSDSTTSADLGQYIPAVPQGTCPPNAFSTERTDMQWFPISGYDLLDAAPSNPFVLKIRPPATIPTLDESLLPLADCSSGGFPQPSLSPPVQTVEPVKGSTWLETSIHPSQNAAFSLDSIDYAGNMENGTFRANGNYNRDDERQNQDALVSANSIWCDSSYESSHLGPGHVFTRKRKRRTPMQTCPYPLSMEPPSDSLSRRLAATANGSLVTGNLMKIYHDSMENALSCWLTERTCPYSLTVRAPIDRSPDGMLEEWGSNWSNRIYKRVFRLDRLFAEIGVSSLPRDDDRAATKALHMSILSFASQWAQGSRRQRAAFPYCRTGQNGSSPRSSADSISNISQYEIFGEEEGNMFPMDQEFDRTIQESTWQQARRALQDAADIESFRVVFAHIIFGLTQKPFQSDSAFRRSTGNSPRSNRSASLYSSNLNSYAGGYTSGQGFHESNSLGSSGLADEAASLSLSELEHLADKDGPPIYLEQGLRHIHTMRSKLVRFQREEHTKLEPMTWPSASIPIRNISRLSAEDSKTIDLLYWLAIMFDTLSAAMHERPPVVSDEDSDITPAADLTSTDLNRSPQRPNLWGDHFIQIASRMQPQRWPCSYGAAARTLNDAAPIKVLLYRKVTRVQTLLARRTKPREAFEEAISDALGVYDYWNRTFDPFFQDCVGNHEDLAHRIQSWYLCLAGHWYLATLLLADVIESVDTGNWGVESHRLMREATDLAGGLRERNAAALAAMANAACPDDDETKSSFSEGREWHDALSEKALLTEPWTQVLIRAFIKAGTLLVRQATKSHSYNACDASERASKAVQDCRSCVKALWYLGRKSDMAMMASELLSQATDESEGCSPGGFLDFFNFH